MLGFYDGAAYHCLSLADLGLQGKQARMRTPRSNSDGKWGMGPDNDEVPDVWMRPLFFLNCGKHGKTKEDSQERYKKGGLEPSWSFHLEPIGTITRDNMTGHDTDVSDRTFVGSSSRVSTCFNISKQHGHVLAAVFCLEVGARLPETHIDTHTHRHTETQTSIMVSLQELQNARARSSGWLGGGRDPEGVEYRRWPAL